MLGVLPLEDCERIELLVRATVLSIRRAVVTRRVRLLAPGTWLGYVLRVLTRLLYFRRRGGRRRRHRLLGDLVCNLIAVDLEQITREHLDTICIGALLYQLLCVQIGLETTERPEVIVHLARVGLVRALGARVGADRGGGGGGGGAFCLVVRQTIRRLRHLQLCHGRCAPRVSTSAARNGACGHRTAVAIRAPRWHPLAVVVLWHHEA